MPDDLQEVFALAVGGDDRATARLIRELLPIVKVRVVRSLTVRAHARRGRDVQQEVEDAAQDVLCRLFANDARVLRSWDPSRGLSLRNFVGLVAEREVGRIVRSGRRTPWEHDPVDEEELQRAVGAGEGPERAVASRDTLGQLWQALREQLSPKGLEMFHALVVEEKPVDEICRDFSMQTEAVYAWRSRLLKRAREIAADLEPPSSASSRTAASPVREGESP